MELIHFSLMNMRWFSETAELLVHMLLCWKEFCNFIFLEILGFFKDVTVIDFKYFKYLD